MCLFFFFSDSRVEFEREKVDTRDRWSGSSGQRQRQRACGQLIAKIAAVCNLFSLLVLVRCGTLSAGCWVLMGVRA